MTSNRQAYLSGLLLLISLFLSNFSALISFVLWLTPAIVYAQALLWLVLAGIFLGMMNGNRDIARLVEVIKKNWFLFPFLVFAGLSILWSVDWPISLSRWLILLCTLVVGGYIGLRYSLMQIIDILSYFGILILFLSALMIIFIPNTGIMNYYTIQGAWKGIFWHKIHMGMIASLINLLFLIELIKAFQSKQLSGWIWLFLYLVSLVFVYKSDSVTAYFTTIILHGLILLAFVWLKIRHKLRPVHYLVFLAVVMAYPGDCFHEPGCHFWCVQSQYKFDGQDSDVVSFDQVLYQSTAIWRIRFQCILVHCLPSFSHAAGCRISGSDRHFRQWFYRHPGQYWLYRSAAFSIVLFWRLVAFRQIHVESHGYDWDFSAAFHVFHSPGERQLEFDLRE